MNASQQYILQGNKTSLKYEPLFIHMVDMITVIRRHTHKNQKRCKLMQILNATNNYTQNIR